jgi:hypothetical protein
LPFRLADTPVYAIVIILLLFNINWYLGVIDARLRDKFERDKL